MANLKKGFVVALAVVTFLCLLQNGRALEQEEKFWAEQYDDWQPSKYTIKTRPTSRVSSQPSPNESINDSSLNLAERNIDPRQRNRNENVGRTFVEGQRSHYDVRGGNFNEERLVNQPVRSPNSNNNNNNNNNRRTRNGFGGFPRRRSEIETSTEFKTNVEYVRRPETTNNVRRFDYKNDQIEGTNGNGDFEVSRTQFSRRSDDIGRSVYPSRRFQVVRKRVPLERRVGGGVNSEPTAQAQLERRMGVGVDDVPTAQAQLERRMGVGVNDVPTAQAQLPVSPDIGNARKNAVVFRGRKHYSPADDNLGKDPTALDRSLQTGFNSKYTTLEVASPPPPDLNEPSQKAFIVLPENQQFRFNEINQQKNGFNQPKTQQNVIPDGRDYQRTRQTLLKQNQQTYRGNNNQYNQYDGRIPQGTKSAENVNRNSNFVFSSFDVGQTTESPKSNVLYQYPENSFLNTLNQQWAPQTNNALTSPRTLLQDDLENSKFPQTNVDKPLDSNRPPDVSPNTSQYQGFDPTTSRSTRRNNQAFRSRTPQRRGEYTTTKRYVVENALPDSAIARSQHTNTFEPFVQTNLIAERHSENKTTEFRGQNNYLGRQRRRQSPSRTNPTKSPVFTVLPSSTAEPANNNFNEIPNLPFEPKSRQENPGSRFSYLRQRSRTPQSNLKPAPVYDPRQRYRNANEVEAEKTSQNPVTPTLRSVTRTTVSRTTTTVTEKPTENKVEEEIDDSANYPKEFLEKLKSSKEQQAPKIHATAPGALSYANDRNVDKVPKWPALESPSQQGRFAQSFRRKTSDKNVNSPVSRNKLEPATKKVNFQATQTPISIPSTISTTFSRIPSTASDTSTTTTTTAVTQESRRFVPKNKISLEQRKQRIELLKEKLRKNATASAERHNLRETLVPQANTHHSSREESDHLPFEDHFHVSSSSSQPSTTAVASLSSETDIKNSHLKQDLLILGSEDHTFISYLDGINGTDKFSESFATSTENPTTTTFTPFSEAVTTQQPDFSVLNVTLFPSTRHRFSSRINSTTNLTIPEDVELINITPTVENTASTEPSLEVSLLNLFNSSLNATGTNENTPETLSVTARLDESTTNFPASTSTTPKSPRSVNTTNRTTTKKKPSGRKKSNKKSSSSTGSTGSPRRGASNKSKTIKNKNSASTTTKRTNDSDEPSSLTNVAFRALSTANEIPLLDVMATTTTMTTTTTRPKKTKTATNSSGRIKIKKMKNLSRTSVMAYKNETQMTSTTAPETVFIVTPMSKTEFGDFGAEPYGDPEMKRQKVKFVTLTPGYVVMTDVRNQNENDILTLSSQHVQKVTKAPANIPDNFLSTVYGEIQEKASSPLPEILKNVGNELEGGNGLSVSLAKRIISLALENAVTTSTTPTAPHSAPSFPSSPDLPSPTPSNQKIPAKHDSIKSANPTKRPKSTSFVTTTEKIHPPVTANPTKGQRFTPRPTTTTTTTTTKPIQEETILITPKRQAVQKVEKKTSTFLQSTEEIPVVTFGGEIFKNPTTKKVETTSSPFIELFNKGIPNKPLSSQKVNEDLNALLSGLWQEPTRQPESFTTTTQRIPTSTTVTTTTTTMTTTTKRTTTKATTTTSTSTKSPNFSNVSSRSKSQQQQQKKIKDEKISLPKKASDALSESDLKLLEGILAQQGIMGGDKELEKIIQNQIRLAEEVRKASRNIKKKKITTTTTTTERTNSGSLGFIFNLFGSNGISNQPAPRGNSKKNTPQTEPDSELNNTPDPFDELNEDTAVADRTARGELVSAAVDVTKAVSKFMGTVLTSAAQSLQTFVRSLRS